MSTKSGLQWIVMIALVAAMLMYHLLNLLPEWSGEGGHDSHSLWWLVRVVAASSVAICTVRWHKVARLVCFLSGTKYVAGEYSADCVVHRNEPGRVDDHLAVEFTIHQSPIRTTIEGTSRWPGDPTPYSTFSGTAFEVIESRVKFAMRLSTNNAEYGVLELIMRGKGRLAGNYYSAISAESEAGDGRQHRVWSWTTPAINDAED